MRLGRALLLAMLVGAAANPQPGVPPERIRLFRGDAMASDQPWNPKPRTRSDIARQLPGRGKLARKAKRAAIAQAIREAKAQRSNEIRVRVG